MLAAMGKLKICKTASCSDSQLQAQLETEAIVFTEDTAPQLQLPRISGASQQTWWAVQGLSKPRQELQFQLRST